MCEPEVPQFGLGLKNSPKVKLFRARKAATAAGADLQCSFVSFTEEHMVKSFLVLSLILAAGWVHASTDVDLDRLGLENTIPGADPTPLLDCITRWQEHASALRIEAQKAPELDRFMANCMEGASVSVPVLDDNGLAQASLVEPAKTQLCQNKLSADVAARPVRGSALSPNVYRTYMSLCLNGTSEM